MNNSRLAYYIGFPSVVFGLCAFSYYLGFTRGKQALSEPVQDMPPVISEEHDAPPQELTFFQTLKDTKEEPTGTEKEKPAVSPKGRTGFVVQISAFRDIGKAHEMIAELNNRGYGAFTETVGGDSNGWHRVFVGPFTARPEAEQKHEALKKIGFGQGFVTELKGN